MIMKHRLVMDLDRGADGKQIDVMQEDQYSRELELHLQANGMPYCPPEDCVVLVRYEGKGEHRGAYDLLPDGTKAWSIQGSILTVALAPQVCAVPGKVLVTVTLRQGSAQLSCFTIGVNVHKGPGSGLKNQPYYHINGFIPQPDKAVVGDVLKVVSVDAQGNITAITGESREGKSAYQYAQEGGYTGTEADFARKLAQDFSGASGDDGNGLMEQECTAELSITGFTRSAGTFSTATSGLRTDFISMEGVTRIFGNAGLYASCATIGFYDAAKAFLPDISLLGTAFIQEAGAAYGEGAFEVDVSGEAYGEAAYFVVSTYRGAQYAGNVQTFEDDYCGYIKLTESEAADTPAYRISRSSIAFFGDSITTGAGEGDYPSIIAAITGATVTNYARSGATLAAGTASNYHIADQVAQYTGADDIICISGGINDFNQSVALGTLTEGYTEALDTTTVIGALESIFRSLLTDHTTAKLYYVITHKASSAEILQNNLGLTFTDYHDAIVRVLKKYAIGFYDAFEKSGFVTSSYGAWGETIRRLYTVNGDGVHPNAAGYLKYYVFQIIDMM